MKVGALQTQLAPMTWADANTFVCKNGDLAQVLSLRKPIGHECLSEDKLAEITLGFNAAVRVIPTGFRHYQYLRKTSGAKIIRKPRYHEPHVNELSGLRSEFLESEGQLGTIEVWHVVLYQAPQLKRSFPLSWTTLSTQLSEEQARSLAKLQACVMEFTSQCRNVNPSIQVLDQAGIHRFLRLLANGAGRTEAPIPEDRLDFYMADESVHVHADHLRVGDTYLRALTLKQSPRESRYDKQAEVWRPTTVPAILAELLTLPGDFLLCLEFAPQNVSKSRRDIGIVRSNQYSKIISGVTDITSPNKPHDARLQDESAKKNVRLLGEADANIDSGNYLGDFSFSFIAYGTSDRQAKDLIETASRILQPKANVVRETGNLYEAWLATIPGNYTFNLRLFRLPVDCYSDLSLLWAANTGQLRDEHLNDEYLTVLETTDKQPFYFTPRIGELFMMMLFGESGSGKSSLSCQLTADFQKYGRKINGVWRRPKTLIYDFGKSFEELTRYFGGEFKQISQGDEESKQNPFSFPATEANAKFVAEWFAFLLTRDDNYQLTADEKASLLASVRGVFALQERLPTACRLSSLHLSDDTPGRLATRLEKWRGGLFDTAVNTFSDADWQTYEFRGFEKHKDALASYLYLINEGWDRHLYDPELISLPKLWVMDEAHIFMLNESLDMGQRMVEKVTTGRKNNLSCLFTMPWGHALEQTKAGATLKSACPVKLFTRSPGTEEAYQRIFGLSPKVAGLVASLQSPGEALIHSDTADVRVKVNYDPYSLLLFSNDSKTIAAKQDAFRQHGREHGLRVLAKRA